MFLPADHAPFLWNCTGVDANNPEATLVHYNGVIMGAMVSQITSLMIVDSAVYSGADQRKHQSSASLAFVRGIHRWTVNSSHNWPVTLKMFPFDDVIMCGLVPSNNKPSLKIYIQRHVASTGDKDLNCVHDLARFSATLCNANSTMTLGITKIPYDLFPHYWLVENSKFRRLYEYFLI